MHNLSFKKIKFQPVGAIHDFRGMALVGFGRFLRMYDIGQKKLLAKCENKVSFFLFFK